MQNTTHTAIENIKDYLDDPHIKIELEGNLDRHEGSECCGGDGLVPCPDCDAYGRVECPDCNDQNSTDCPECRGRGEVECEECDGESQIECEECDGNNYREAEDCEEFILGRVSPEARNALTFSYFYYDGSVDSEFTFTLPIDATEYIPEFIEAFNALGEAVGNGISIGGAGMHTSIMEGGRYRPHDGPFVWEEHKIDNFIRQNKKLLPALYFLAANKPTTRPMEYRPPQVGEGRGAIAVYRNCIEYRIFDPCYDKPEYIFDIVEIIEKTLRFYDNPNKRIRGKRMRFRFYENNDSLQRFYQDAEQLEYAEKMLKHLKPDNKNLRDLKRERGFNLTVNKLKQRLEQEYTEYRQEFEEYQQRQQQQKQEMLATVRNSLQNPEMQINLYRAYGTENHDTIEQRFIEENCWPERSFQEFIRERTSNRYEYVELAI